MGYYSDGKTQKSQFDPNDTITVAEVATVVSRMLRGNKHEGSNIRRYHNHLLALKKKGLMKTGIDPKEKETRASVYTLLWELQS